MATIHYGQVNPGRYSGSSCAKYDSLREELKELRVGDTFKATFPAKYSATCARHALSHYCRRRLFYQVECHQRGSVLEITRTK